MKLKNKKILVYGLGKSGRAVVKFLQNRNAYVSIFDDDLNCAKYPFFERNPKQKSFDFVVVSPGVCVRDNEILKFFYDNKIPVLSELDFGFLFCKGKIVSVTGTNGKTTVSMLVHKILKTAGFETFLCGNIGLPITAIVEKTTKRSVVVCEVSNFQLETSKFFHPNVATILNLKPDHLDRHGSFDEYVRVKKLIAQNMGKRDFQIVNLDDEISKRQILCKNTIFFSKKEMKNGVFVKNDAIWCDKKQILPLENIPLKGEKNLENVLASVALCKNFFVSAKHFRTAIESFCPASHRMEIVGIFHKAVFVDDSKATNVASTVACVEAFKNEKIILLVGGKSKEFDFDEIFENKCDMKIVCFGMDRQKIFDCAKKFCENVSIFEKFEQAVEYAKLIASENDYVLLSPACASFDEFENYAERGERFKELIQKK